MIAIYCRVSSAKQTENETIQNQLDYAKKYCALHDITPVYYLDDGITGTIPMSERPEGKRLMDEASNGSIKELLVYKIDRIGRSTRIILNTIHELEKHGCTVKSMTEPFDTSTPSGRFMLTMLAGVADLERSNIVERMLLGKIRALSKGRWMYGIPPYGYQLNEDSTLSLSNEAKTVKKIFDMYLTGNYSHENIADYLTAHGVPLPPNRLKAKYPEWRPAGVTYILKNTIYTGVYTGAECTLEVPQIVTQQDFDKVQELIKNRVRFSRRNAHHNYLLSSLVKCARCGYSYVGKTGAGNRGPVHYYYYCTNRSYYKRRNAPQCLNKTWRADKLDEIVWDKVVNKIKESASRVKPVRSETTSAPMDDIKSKIKQADEEMERVLDLYRTGIMTMADIKGQIDKIKKKKSILQRELNKAPATHITQYAGIKKDILQIISKDDLEDEVKKKIIRLVVQEVRIDGDSVVIYYNVD